MRRFDAADPGFDDRFGAFLDERRGAPADVDAAVREIIEQVRTEGLAALLRLALKFDRVELDETSIRVGPGEIEEGAAACKPEIRQALELAACGAQIRRVKETGDDDQIEV